MENIHQGHRKRLKEQFLRNGLQSLQPHQIIEMLLFYAIPRADTNEIAHHLIDKYENIYGILNAPYDELVNVKGLGENGATFLKFLPQLLRVYSVDSMKNKPLDNINAVTEYFTSHYIGVKNEQLRLCCLDDNLNVINCQVIHDGGVNIVPVNVRKIVEKIFEFNCSLVILSHNHPKGISQPSDADIRVTRQLMCIFKSLGIRLLDHVILGTDGVTSMKYSGYFNAFEI